VISQVLQVADVIDLCGEARAASIATLDHVPCDAGVEPVATGHGRDPCKTVRHSCCRAHAGPGVAGNVRREKSILIPRF